MDTFEQYTVYVSKEASSQTQEKINWAEVRYRLKQSNKSFLTLGFMFLFGGSTYLMQSTLSFADDPTLPVKIFSWAFLSWGTLHLSMRGVQPFETIKDESSIVTSADDIRTAITQIGIEVKTTKDLFRLLELGKIELFNNIREHTLATLRPRREKDFKQVDRFFDTIQYCVENNQKTMPDDVKISVEINDRSYPEISGVYINKLMGTRYKSANLYLEWLSD